MPVPIGGRRHEKPPLSAPPPPPDSPRVDGARAARRPAGGYLLPDPPGRRPPGRAGGGQRSGRQLSGGVDCGRSRGHGDRSPALPRRRPAARRRAQDGGGRGESRPAGRRTAPGHAGGGGIPRQQLRGDLAHRRRYPCEAPLRSSGAAIDRGLRGGQRRSSAPPGDRRGGWRRAGRDLGDRRRLGRSSAGASPPTAGPWARSSGSVSARESTVIQPPSSTRTVPWWWCGRGRTAPASAYSASASTAGRIHWEGRSRSTTISKTARRTRILRSPPTAALSRSGSRPARTRRRRASSPAATTGPACRAAASSPSTAAPPAPQQRPSVALAPDGTLLFAWEDRRSGPRGSDASPSGVRTQ